MSDEEAEQVVARMSSATEALAVALRRVAT
jgi:hypothetical protein